MAVPFLRALVVSVLLIPVVVLAFPFGGQIYVYHVCYNETIFTRLTPPVPGDYVWTTATKTYQFGPPRAVGQWLLGLTSIPFDCLWSVNPIFPVPAIAIMMMGSSGPAAPMSPGGAFGAMPAVPTNPGMNQSSSNYTYAPTPTLPAPGVAGVVLSEVFYNVDAQHGTDPTHEWVEIYNGSSLTVDLSGWTVQDGALADVIPQGTTLGPNKFLVVAETSAIRNYWSIPTSATVIALASPIGDGLANAGDVVRLRNKSGAIIDAVSWGTNTSAFTPSVPTVQSGRSIARQTLARDTNAASDWIERTTPTPGQ